MRSKNSKALTAVESEHLATIKSMRCIVCGAAGPSDAHHIVQGDHFSCIPLCRDCHMGSKNGIHGQKVMWRIMKMDEVDALAKTIRVLLTGSIN